MTTTTAAATWPTQAELDPIMRRVEVASDALDDLDVKRLSPLVRDGIVHEQATLENLGALARFIELVEMDLKVMSDGVNAARAALHAGAGETWVDPRAQSRRDDA